MAGFSLNIASGSGAKSKTITINLSENATVADLKSAYAKASKKSVHRLSFKKEGSGKSVVRLEDDRKTLKSYNINDTDELVFKDLGAQIGYRTVFVVEYAGPLLIVLLYAMRPALIFGADANTIPYNWVAKMGIICWTIHFLKREFETFFVHKFSR